MKSIIQVNISKGDKYYVAEGVNVPFVTQAKTLDDLTLNIQEAVDLALEGEDLSKYDIAQDHSVYVNFELPKVYA